GQEVAGGGVGDDGPVRVGAGAETDALEPVACPLDDAEGGAAGALDATDAERSLRASRLGGARLERACQEPAEHVERLKELDGALLEPRLDVAGNTARSDGLEAVVGQSVGGCADVLGDAAGSGGGSDRAEGEGVLARNDADVGEPVLEGAVEEELAPGASRLGLDPLELCAGCDDRVPLDRERAAGDGDRAEEEAVPGQRGVEPPRALGQRGEAVVPGRESDAGADRGDVVEVAPDPLQLQQDRADASELGRRVQPERRLPGMRVGGRVRDGAGGAGALDVGEPLVRGPALGGPLEAAVLVEQARVEVEDPVADDVEAEMPGFDHAGVDRSDRDLVGVMAVDGHRPAREVEVVIDERTQRHVAVEGDPAEVGRLALVPRCRGHEVDDRGHTPLDALDARRPVGGDEHRPDGRAGGMQPAEPPACGERLLDPGAVAHRIPSASARAIELPGSHSAAAASARSAAAVTGASTATPRRPSAGERSRRPVLPASVSISACARPRKPSASSSADAPAAQGRPAAKPPATISTSLAKSGDGGRPASAPSETPIAVPSIGSLRATPPTACPAARGSCASNGTAA